MALGRTRTVIKLLTRGAFPLVFLLQTLVLRDPAVPVRSTLTILDAVERVPSRPSALPGRPPQTTVAQGPLLSLADAEPNDSGFPSMEWESFPRTLSGIMERLRAEVGFDVSPVDFQGPGSLDALWSWSGIKGPTTPRWMKATVTTATTPVGRSLDVNLFLVSGSAQVAVSFRNLTNERAWFPAVNLELFEYPVRIANNAILVSPRLAVWAQPPNQLPDSTRWQWGGLWLVNLEIPLDEDFGLWAQGSAKTEGWAPGFQSSNQGWTLRTGIHWML